MHYGPVHINCCNVLCIIGYAQEFRATVGGAVTDPTAAPVPAAKVTVTSVERNTIEQAETNETGRYLVQFLLPGQYTVAVEKQGFKRVVRQAIAFSSSDRANVNISLEVGGVAESVTVSPKSVAPD